MRKTCLYILLAAISGLACSSLSAEPVPPPPMPGVGEPVALPDEPERQFDFWLGEWEVINRHLQPDGSWPQSGQAQARIQPVAGGSAILERWTGKVGGNPLNGFSLRAWDPSLGKWAIYLNWHGGKPGGFFLMHGERNGERMELFPPGTKQQMRYTFSEARTESCQWDSAGFKDGHWYNDWVMQFTRAAPSQPADSTNIAIDSPPEAASQFPETRKLDGLLGTWKGRAKKLLDDGKWAEGSATARVTSMIEGFGLLAFVDTSWDDKSMSALAWESGSGKWATIRAASDRPGLDRLEGSLEGDVASFSTEDLRETWTRRSADSYLLERAVSKGNGEWQVDLTVEFERINP